VLEICHVACVSRTSQSDTGTVARSQPSHAASCHDAGESLAPLSLHSHPCGHGDDLAAPAGVASARQSKFGTPPAAAIPAIDRVAGAPMRTQTRTRPRSSDPSAAQSDLILPLRI
jgi:hypothetical protein